MDTVMRLGRAISYKIVMYPVLGAVLLYILWNRTFQNVIFNFMFADVVPGSNRMLAPTAVIRAVIIGLSLGIIIGLSLWIGRRLSYRKVLRTLAARDTVLYDTTYERSVLAIDTRNQDEPAVQLDAESVELSADSVDPVVTKPHAKIITGAVLQSTRSVVFRKHRISTQAIEYELINKMLVTLSRFMTSLFAVVQTTLRHIRSAAMTIAWYGAAVIRVIVVVLKQALKLCAVSLVIAAVVSGSALAIVWSYSILYARQLWGWTAPYASRFDRWLERQCRGMLTALRRKSASSETVQVVTDIIRDGKDSLRELLAKLS